MFSAAAGSDNMAAPLPGIGNQGGGGAVPSPPAALHEDGAISNSRSSSFSPGASRAANFCELQGPFPPSVANVQGVAGADRGTGTGTGVEDPKIPRCARVRVFSPELDIPLLRALLYDKQYQYTKAAGVRGETPGVPRTSQPRAAGGGGGGGAGVSDVAPTPKGKRKLINAVDMNAEDDEDDEDDESDDIVNVACGSERGQGGGRGGPSSLATLLRGVHCAGTYDGAWGAAGGSGGASSSGLPHRSYGKGQLAASLAVDDVDKYTHSLAGGRGSEREQGGGGGPKTGADHVLAGGGGTGSVPQEQVLASWELEKPLVQCRVLRMVATHALDRLADIDKFSLFKEPVTGVNGYKEVIKQPMDFFSIRRRLQRGHYACIQGIAADVKLVCTNAVTFNEPHDLHYAEAK